jgi:putative hemolysin
MSIDSNPDHGPAPSGTGKKIAAGWLTHSLQPAGRAGKLLFPVLYRLLNFQGLDALYEKCSPHHGVFFARRVLELLKIRLEVLSSEVSPIPQSGACAIVANHPHGFLDGLLLMDFVARYRSEFHLTVNYLLDDVLPLRDYLISVNAFAEHKVPRFATPAIRRILISLTVGNPVCFFPSADVSCFQFPRLRVADPPWSLGCFRLIKNANVPVIPVFIHGRNSIFFQIVRLIHPALGLARLASEFLSKTSQCVQVRVGQPIPPEALHPDLGTAAAVVRSAVYSLGEQRTDFPR